MKNITTNTLVLLTILASPFVLAQGGGALGGNPSVETGAVNVSVGKCIQYKIDVKTVKRKGKERKDQTLKCPTVVILRKTTNKERYRKGIDAIPFFPASHT